MRVNPKAQIPQAQSEGAIGLDLQSVQQVTIPAHERRLIPTGLVVEIPKEHYARIAPRSGLSVKHSLDVSAGVIDPDFRGEMQVLLVNHKDQPYTVNEGDRIAQLILEQATLPTIKEVTKLSSTK